MPHWCHQSGVVASEQGRPVQPFQGPVVLVGLKAAPLASLLSSKASLGLARQT